MALLDSPDSTTATTTTTTTTTEQTDLDLNFSPHLRRRPSDNAEANTALDSTEAHSFSSINNHDEIGASTARRVELSNGKELINENISAAKGEDREQPQQVFAKYAYRASAPAHRRIKESPLSSDAIFKQMSRRALMVGFGSMNDKRFPFILFCITESHAGLFNLCIVVLVAVNSRLIIENLMKYGLLISSGFWFSSRQLRDWPLLMCCLSLNILPLAAFTIEKLVRKKYISEPVVVTLHIIISTSAVLYPVFMILSFDSAVLSGVTLMLFACIVWLKLVSYAHANYDMRVLVRAVGKGEALPSSSDMDYYYDASFKSLAYFVVAPTLCYQPSYPRTACVRKGWVVRQLIKLVIFTGLMGFIIEQYINPIVKNSQHPLKGNLLYAIERVLKLSVPNLYVWLCMFYCFFHLWLNILAELLCFGDREFYKDWWNAKTVEEYWRMWNMPVHKWMVRHIYFPCLRNGIPKGSAVLIAFFLSAVFHELCIAVPCHIFKFWAFFGIMLQVPLVMVTNYLQDKFRNSMVGNMMFWCFFSILGYPTAPRYLGIFLLASAGGISTASGILLLRGVLHQPIYWFS